MTHPLILQAEYRGEYYVFLRFTDGTEGTADLAAMLQNPSLKPIRNPRDFSGFSLDRGTLVWPSGVEMPPQVLFKAVLETRVNTLARRHQVPCPVCEGKPQGTPSAGRVQCTTCHDEGQIGNCPDCVGRGVFIERSPGEIGCIVCQTKGWIGNCRACRGIGIVDVVSGYAACVTCDGYGHLEADLRPQGRARFAAVCRYSSQPRFRVACDARLGFGRWGRPHTRVDVRLHDRLVAKEHFEIVWDDAIGIHVARNLGARYPPEVRGRPVGDEGQPLQVGDEISIGEWGVEYVALLAGEPTGATPLAFPGG